MSGKLSDARNKTESLLYSKTTELLNQAKESVAGIVYEDAVGVASLVEKKKAKKKEEDDDNGKKYAKKTDKEDDGEGLDPVDAEDSDIDNDGDSDESDEYLNNRRKVRKKKIEGEDDEEDEVNENKGDGRESHIYGMPLKKYRALTDKQKHQIKMKWSHQKAEEEKAKGHRE